MTEPNPAAKRTHCFPVPDPAKANPADWDAEEIATYGLPERPDAEVQPGLYRIWMNTFGKQLCFSKYVPGKGPGFDLHRLDVDTPHDTTDSSPLGATRFLTSPNWSGSYLSATSGRTFRQIWGQWIVPTPSLPEGLSLPRGHGSTDHDPSVSYQCSTWIGLDGQRLYLNSSLPQMGTAQQVTLCADGRQEFRTWAWTQWWARNDKDTLPVPISNLTIRHGDVIRCVLTVADDRLSVVCNMINQSCSPPVVTAIRIDSPPVPKRPGQHYVVSGATAEWVLERPAVPDQTGHAEHSSLLQPFPDYGTTNFSACYAVLDGVKATALRDLSVPRFIRMYEVRANPQRTAYISMPMRIDNASFAVSHGGFDV